MILWSIVYRSRRRQEPQHNHQLSKRYDVNFIGVCSSTRFEELFQNPRWPVQTTLEKPAPSTSTAPSSSFSATGAVRSAAARLLGAGNGSRALSFVGGNGATKTITGNSGMGVLGTSSSSSSPATSNFDGKGTYLIFNVGDAIFISDLNSQDKVLESLKLLMNCGSAGDTLLLNYFRILFAMHLIWMLRMVMICSLGQTLLMDMQLLLWDLEMDEIVVPVKPAISGGSPTYSNGERSAHWDNSIPIGTLQPAPSIRDVRKISPLVAHRVHTEPLSGFDIYPGFCTHGIPRRTHKSLDAT